MIAGSLFFGEFTLASIGPALIRSAGNGPKTSFSASPNNPAWGFRNIGTESPVKPSSATIAALYELFLASNRIAQWPQFAPRYGFGHRE